MRDSKKGFTLIELLVVIAIIGILSSVVVASLNSARKKARDVKRISDIKQIQMALALYNDAQGVYPPTLASASLVDTGYISVIPTDPSAGGSYQYAALGSGASCDNYHLGATLEETTNAALSGDKDAAAAPSTSLCTDSGADFNGADPVYDVTP